MNKELELIFYKNVHGHTGIYAEKTNGVNRTEWQEGWNACSSSIRKRLNRLKKWWKELPEPKTRLEELLRRGILDMATDGEMVELSVDCSDLFFWGCSDSEEIAMEELDSLEDCLKESTSGRELWCCRKRKMRPQAAYYDIIPKEEWVLFDGVGEERTDPDGRKS